VKAQNIDWKTRREQDRRKAAWHEAGHFIVASHYGLAHSCWLIERGVATEEHKAFTGQTGFFSSTPFRNAAIAWAGVLGEEAQGRDVDGWKFETQILWEYFNDSFPDEMSETDLKMVNSTPYRRRAFDTAVHILAKRFPELKAVAASLIRVGVFPANI
jgi:hypothetical protein